MDNKRDIILIILSGIFRSIATGSLGIITGLYLYNVLHLSFTLIGVFFGVGAFSVPLMSIYFGRLGDRYGRKKILLIVLLFLPLSILILLSTSSYPFLLLSAALGGFGTAGALASGSAGAIAAPIMNALLADKTNEENRTKVYSLFFLSLSLAGAVGALLSHLNYRNVFIIALILSIASPIIILPVKDEYSNNLRIARNSSMYNSNNLNNPNESDKKVIKRFIATGALNGLGQGLVTPFLPLIFEVLLKVPKGEIGNIFFLGGIAAAFVSLLTPLITSRLGFVKTVILTRSISTIALILLPFVNMFSPILSYDLMFALALYIIYIMFRVISLPTQSSLMMNLVSQDLRSTATGMNQAARLFPSAIATISSGFIINYLALPIPFFLAFIVNIANIYLYKKFFKDIETSKGMKSVLTE
ncbi:Permease of the major facilitator superfamily [Candidatus Nanobsidianus stetteri]|uniref:Permease of the major facilitator superfamily n=1 Tax=Nanobsidianus stetteri TaxID=1294122 RepID=R1FU38_NANST|nr:Permease of the major facilitator superfamily [Candidatus Nanobsidianus stetteri]